MAARTIQLSGIHVPLITPFDARGNLCADSLESLARDVLDRGAAGLVALGTTAEAAALDAHEQAAVVEVCARVCAARGASLVVGAGGAGTRSTAARLAGLAGVPAVGAALVTVPAFVRPSEEGVLEHFGRLAADSPVPLVVYHVPYRTGRSLSAAALQALGSIPQVIGVKYATGGIDQDTVGLLGALPPGFSVLAGDDVLLSPLLALGASGGIPASAHLATEHFAALAAAWEKGDAPRARGLGHPLARLSEAVFAEPNPAVVKGVLHAQERIPTPDVRLPLLPAARASVERALRLLADVARHPLG